MQLHQKAEQDDIIEEDATLLLDIDAGAYAIPHVNGSPAAIYPHSIKQHASEEKVGGGVGVQCVLVDFRPVNTLSGVNNKPLGGGGTVVW